TGVQTCALPIFLVGTALIGMGVGRNPSGFVHDLVEGYRATRGAKPVLYGAGAFGAVLYVLALTGVIGTWTFAIIALCAVMLVPVLGRVYLAETSGDGERRPRPTPLELVGVDEPYTDELRARLDRELGLPATLEKGGSRDWDRRARAPRE